jgi:hypothetical protein
VETQGKSTRLTSVDVDGLRRPFIRESLGETEDTMLGGSVSGDGQTAWVGGSAKGKEEKGKAPNSQPGYKR